MSNQFKQILKQATLLTPGEQLALIAALSQQLAVADLATDLDVQAFSFSLEEEAELMSRISQVESGEVEALPWKAALSRLKERYG